MISFLARPLAIAACVLPLALASGCASGPNANPRDPLEPFNRGVTRFNDGVDRAVLKPVAQVYDRLTPALVRTGWTAVNAVLQLKPQAAVDSLFRFQLNTMFGLGGLLDIASDANIERHKEDFGRTLGRWGVPAGPYLVLPLLGPSTVRDTAALSINTLGNGITYFNSEPLRYTLYGLRLVEARANLLRASTVLDEAALDKYTFTRDVFLQLRGDGAFDGDAADPDATPESPAK